MIGRMCLFPSRTGIFHTCSPFTPLRLLHYEDPAQQELIRRSITHWSSQDAEFAGYSYVAAAIFYAMIGDGDGALAQLERYRARFGTPNTMYLEHGGWGAPTLETPLIVLAAVQEMLLQTHDGVIRPFPAVPATWTNVSLRDWRAEGALLVSATQERGQMTTLTVKSEVGGACRVQLPPGRYRHHASVGTLSQLPQEIEGGAVYTFPSIGR
jgi:hypothetical protein